MARLTHFSVEQSHPRVKFNPTTSPEFPINIDMSADGWIRLTCAEAVQLRDDLSRAITEAATAAAQAVQAEGEAA